MSSQLQSVMTELLAKTERLSEKQRLLEERCRELETENEDLRRQLQQTEKERDNARLDAQYLTVSHRLADDPDTIVETRRRLSSLIRRVDKAIRLATDDPSL